MALGLLLPEPVGQPHDDAALFGKDVLQLKQDLDDFLETVDDADAALGRLLFERGVAHLQQEDRLCLRGADDFEAVEKLIVDDDVEPQARWRFRRASPEP